MAESANRPMIFIPDIYKLRVEVKSEQQNYSVHEIHLNYSGIIHRLFTLIYISCVSLTQDYGVIGTLRYTVHPIYK